MAHIITDRLRKLREEMARARVDALIVTDNDPHQSEYLAPHWQLREYLSGFTGSAGTLLVTASEALLWTDSRYFIQASAQLEGTGISLMKDGLPSTPSMVEWITANLKSGDRVAFDPWLVSARQAMALIESLLKHGLVPVTDFNLAHTLWPDRPPMPRSRAFVHEEKYAGEGVSSKLASLRMSLASGENGAILISALDRIAWLLNLRGSDVKCNPVNMAYLFVGTDSATLFIDPAKLTPEVTKHLGDCGVATLPYGSLAGFLASLDKDTTVATDFSETAYAVVEILGSRAVDTENPVERLKAIKNDVQIEGFRNAMRRDGAALARGFMEIERRLESGVPTTEIDVADILRARRAEQPLFFDESFDTIAAFGPHGAIVHYTATPGSNSGLRPGSLLLVDSGAQYLDGTTDITRTIAIGEPGADEKRDFTLALKGLIALSMAVFPEGTTGIQLDTLAKQFMWREGYQYLHGTGHGVGHFLNVHEGPQSIRSNRANYLEPVKAGMVTSNEPGIYREGRYGIRCENLVLAVETPMTGADGYRYLAFETLTLFPFDTALIDTDRFSPDERLWLNAYHKRVYSELAPLLDSETRLWLARKTQEI